MSQKINNKVHDIVLEEYIKINLTEQVRVDPIETFDEAVSVYKDIVGKYDKNPNYVEWKKNFKEYSRAQKVMNIARQDVLDTTPSSKYTSTDRNIQPAGPAATTRIDPSALATPMQTTIAIKNYQKAKKNPKVGVVIDNYKERYKTARNKKPGVKQKTPKYTQVKSDDAAGFKWSPADEYFIDPHTGEKIYMNDSIHETYMEWYAHEQALYAYFENNPHLKPLKNETRKAYIKRIEGNNPLSTAFHKKSAKDQFKIMNDAWSVELTKKRGSKPAFFDSKRAAQQTLSQLLTAENIPVSLKPFGPMTPWNGDAMFMLKDGRFVDAGIMRSLNNLETVSEIIEHISNNWIRIIRLTTYGRSSGSFLYLTPEGRCILPEATSGSVLSAIWTFKPKEGALYIGNSKGNFGYLHVKLQQIEWKSSYDHPDVRQGMSPGLTSLKPKNVGPASLIPDAIAQYPVLKDFLRTSDATEPEQFIDQLQTFLDWTGMIIPGPDAINVLISINRTPPRYFEALISAIGILPLAGDAIKATLRVGFRRIIKLRVDRQAKAFAKLLNGTIPVHQSKTVIKNIKGQVKYINRALQSGELTKMESMLDDLLRYVDELPSELADDAIIGIRKTTQKYMRNPEDFSKYLLQSINKGETPLRILNELGTESIEEGSKIIDNVSRGTQKWKIGRKIYKFSKGVYKQLRILTSRTKAALSRTFITADTAFWKRVATDPDFTSTFMRSYATKSAREAADKEFKATLKQYVKNSKKIRGNRQLREKLKEIDDLIPGSAEYNQWMQELAENDVAAYNKFTNKLKNSHQGTNFQDAISGDNVLYSCWHDNHRYSLLGFTNVYTGKVTFYQNFKASAGATFSFFNDNATRRSLILLYNEFLEIQAISEGNENYSEQSVFFAFLRYIGLDVKDMIDTTRKLESIVKSQEIYKRTLKDKDAYNTIVLDDLDPKQGLPAATFKNWYEETLIPLSERQRTRGVEYKSGMSASDREYLRTEFGKLDTQKRQIAAVWKLEMVSWMISTRRLVPDKLSRKISYKPEGSTKTYTLNQVYVVQSSDMYMQSFDLQKGEKINIADFYPFPSGRSKKLETEGNRFYQHVLHRMAEDGIITDMRVLKAD